MEVDLEKGLMKALQINLDRGSHEQVLDYEQILFKCMFSMLMEILLKMVQKTKKSNPLQRNN